MIRAVAVLLLVGTSLCCLTVVADARTDFRITGKVTDGRGVGLSGVAVRFVDTGLDERARLGSEGTLLGYTDTEGRLSIPFTYYWGYTKSGGRKANVPGTFSLILSKNGLSPVVRDFTLADLKKTNGDYLVPFDVSIDISSQAR